MNQPLLTRIDHLVYSTSDLEKSVVDLETRLGVRPAPGGQHPGRGTHNALLALSDRSYLEVIGPDATQAETIRPRWFQIDSLDAPHLVTWAVKAADLNELRAKAKACGIYLGPVVSGTRHRSDGACLRWRFTDPETVVAEGIVPFFIDWGDSPHPADSAPRGPVLESLRAEHPEPSAVMRALSAVGIDLPVQSGPRPALIATLRIQGGLVELR
jgi:hypothetical protein